MATQDVQPSRTEPRFFYGYTVVICALFIMIAVFGVRFSFGVFFKPMANELGWSSATTSSAFAISILVEGVMGIVMGGLADKLGPRIVLTLCGFLLGLGFLLMSQVSALWQMYLFYGLIIGAGMSGFFVTLVSITARWFTKRRALMTGVVLTGIGIGTLIASPIANHIIYTYNWQVSYLILGGTVLVVVILLAQFLKRDPSVVGGLPYGEPAHVGHQKLETGASLSLREAVSTIQFWLIFILFLSLGFCIYSIIVHLVPGAIEAKILPSTAANILALAGGISIIGRVSLGNIADRIGGRKALIICFILMSAALFWLSSVTALWAFILFAIVFSLGQGGSGSAQSPLVAELFGLKSLGLLYGCLGVGFTIGGALGPFISGYLFDVTGSYQWAFLVAAAVGIIGMIITAFLKPLKRKSMPASRTQENGHVQFKRQK